MTPPKSSVGPKLAAVRPPVIAPIPTIGVREIFAAPSRIEFAIPALHAVVGRATLVYGPPAVGKSIVLEDGGVALATGQPCLGHAARSPMRVLWLDGEVGPLTLSRIQRLARARGVGEAEIGDRIRVAIYPDVSLDDRNAEATLAATCAGFDVVYLDSLTALSGAADENTPEVGRLLLMLARVSTRTGAAIVVLHHSRRDGEIRGSTSIKAGTECHWRMSARGRSITMLHERSPIGDLHSEISLRIRDVAIDGDPLGGLAVDIVTDSEAVAAARSLEDEIVAYLAKNGGHAGGADSLASTIGRKDTDVRAAVGRLVRSNVVARTGKSQNTRIDLRSTIR